MDNCQSCSYLPDIHESGFIYLYGKQSRSSLRLIDILKSESISYSDDNGLMKCNYTTFHQLDALIELVSRNLLEEDARDIFGSWTATEDLSKVRFPNMVAFPILQKRISNRSYLTIINQKMFTQHIQPVISLSDLSVYGYEFLLRPSQKEFPFFPGELFQFAQESELQSLLDGQARISSMEVGSRLLPNGTKRFINFLPSSIYDPNHCLKSTFKAVEKYGILPDDLVFEVVETEKIEDMAHLKNIFQTYQEYGVHVALDDVGTGYSTLEVLRELKPNFAKLDRSLIDNCDQSKEKQLKIKEILAFTKDYGIKLLAEGIERKEEALYCQQLGVDLAQGYYFGKPAEQPLQEKLVQIT